MDREQKKAFARVISDLIEADFIVEKREMDYFEKVISRENLRITQTMLIEGKHLTLAKAVKELRGLPKEEKDKVISLIKELALADGTCVPQEAILILALIKSLEGNGEIISVKSGDLHLENLTAIYIENENGTATDSYVEKYFREINNELAMAGFRFVYIPHIARDFDKMDKDYLQKVVTYMIPSASEEKVSKICDDLCHITTVRFCRDLLYKKIGLDLTSAPPSLLFKVNDSAIVDPFEQDDAERVTYSNFLLLNMGNDMLGSVRKMVDEYVGMVSNVVPIQFQPGYRRFLYNGFHRSLFDLICYGREMKEYRLIIDMGCRNTPVVFQSLDGEEEITVKMGAQEAALFILIVQESLNGDGLDWREHIPKEEKKLLMEKYNAIYREIGKGRVAIDYKDRTQAHHIRTKVKALLQMANRNMFMPELLKDGRNSYYRVVAPDSYVVFVKGQ